MNRTFHFLLQRQWLTYKIQTNRAHTHLHILFSDFVNGMNDTNERNNKKKYHQTYIDRSLVDKNRIKVGYGNNKPNKKAPKHLQKRENRSELKRKTLKVPGFHIFLCCLVRCRFRYSTRSLPLFSKCCLLLSIFFVRCSQLLMSFDSIVFFISGHCYRSLDYCYDVCGSFFSVLSATTKNSIFWYRWCSCLP